MEVRIDLHTLERAEERGTNEDEIKDVIDTGFAVPAKHGRMGRAKIYEYGTQRHGKYYQQKRVEVIYIVEGNAVITVTAYVFYGTWEGQK